MMNVQTDSWQLGEAEGLCQPKVRHKRHLLPRSSLLLKMTSDMEGALGAWTSPPHPVRGRQQAAAHPRSQDKVCRHTISVESDFHFDLAFCMRRAPSACSWFGPFHVITLNDR